MARPLTAATSQSPWHDRLAVAVLAAIAVAAALTFHDYGLGWDDYTHSQYGELLLLLYRSGFHDTRALSFVNLYYYGGGFDMAAGLLAKISPFDLFETRRLLGAIVGLGGLYATWRIGRRTGGPLAGLIALLLLAACPLYYGHMFMNAKDAPFAAAMALFLLGLVRALEQYPKPRRTTVLILGLGFGLSIGSRILAGFGVVDALAAMTLLVAADARTFGLRAAGRGFLHFLVALIPAALLAYAVMALVWPWSVAEPLDPFRAVGYFSQFFEKPWRELYEGALIQPPDMPRSYVPTLMALKLPEVFLALSATGLCCAVAGVLRRAVEPRRRAVLLALALAGALPVLVTVIERPAMYNGIRHFIFVLPPLAVLGGLAGAWIAERAMRFGRGTPAALAALLAIGVALPAVAMARLHPYEYVSFNHLAGGTRGAQSRFMLDYWGLAFKQAGNALRDQLKAKGEAPPPGAKWKIGVCGPHPPAQIALGKSFDLSWDPKGADFALQLGVFYCAKLDAPVLVEIVRDGVVFARAYDLRGRHIESLFTYPEVVKD